jgi:hypothetical protein
MVEATDFANRDDLAEFRLLNWAAVGRILVEREVSTRPVVVREVASQGAAQVPFAKDQYVIQTLAPDGADKPLREGVLPRAVRRREDFTDAQTLHALPERVTVDRIAIAEEVRRRGVIREGVHDLLGRPGSGGMLGDIEVEDAPAVVGKHDEDEQHTQPRGGNREEVDGDEVLSRDLLPTSADRSITWRRTEFWRRTAGTHRLFKQFGHQVRRPCPF